MPARIKKGSPAASRASQPSRRRRARAPSATLPRAAAIIPTDANQVTLTFDDRSLTLSNLQKPFWPKPLITKGDLLRYYAEISPVLLPHLRVARNTRGRPREGSDLTPFLQASPAALLTSGILSPWRAHC